MLDRYTYIISTYNYSARVYNIMFLPILIYTATATAAHCHRMSSDKPTVLINKPSETTMVFMFGLPMSLLAAQLVASRYIIASGHLPTKLNDNIV